MIIVIITIAVMTLRIISIHVTSVVNYFILGCKSLLPFADCKIITNTSVTTNYESYTITGQCPRKTAGETAGEPDVHDMSRRVGYHRQSGDIRFMILIFDYDMTFCRRIVFLVSIPLLLAISIVILMVLVSINDSCH